MKLLLNMNVARELGGMLEPHGHAWRHVGDIGMARATDAEIVAEAERAGETILTHDLDYGNLLAFAGSTRPSVVIFRFHKLATADLAARFVGAWPRVEAALTRGAVVVLETGGVRIRPLPIGVAPT